MNVWLRHHWHSFVQTLARLGGSPGATALNVLVIGVALALPLGAYALLVNLQVLPQSGSVQTQVSVFLAPEATSEDAREAQKRLRAEAGVKEVRFVSKDAALADLKNRPDFREVIEALRENPLPDALIVTLGREDPELAERLVAAAKAIPSVAHVQTDSAWAKRLDALLALGRTGITLHGLLLGLALVAVTFNTIRLQILTHRDEIEVAKLMGATDAYVRRPFFYLGWMQGALGGLTAIAIIAGVLALLDRDVTALVALYGGAYHLSFLPWDDNLAFVAFASLLGWLGAYLSVSRHLHEIEYK
jgi:cell division transport system permease protein